MHRFKYKNFVANYNDTHVTGFIADEFEQYFPKAVIKNNRSFPVLDTEGNPVMKTITEEITEKNEEGNEIITIVEKNVPDSFIIEQCASIDTSQIITTMYGAMQKMMEKIEMLEADNITLKNEIATLKNI